MTPERKAELRARLWGNVHVMAEYHEMLDEIDRLEALVPVWTYGDANRAAEAAGAEFVMAAFVDEYGHRWTEEHDAGDLDCIALDIETGANKSNSVYAWTEKVPAPPLRREADRG